MPPRRERDEREGQTWEQARMWLMDVADNVMERQDATEVRLTALESGNSRSQGAKGAILLALNTLISLIAAIAAVAVLFHKAGGQ